jgi:hypothetical protein
MSAFLKSFIGTTDNEESLELAIREVEEKVHMIKEKNREKRL